jgi:type IV pilus assembly protein PilM
MQELFKRLVNPRIEAIGLEVGTSAIKIVELRSGSPPSLRALAIRPTPPGTIQDGQVIEPQAIAAEIKAGLAEAKIRNKYVVTSIANQAAITRIIPMPKMSLKELDEAIKWEAERYIPFPIDEVVLDYDILDNPDDIPADGQMEVMIAAAQHETIARLVEVIKLAGLEPVVIDVKPFAALRALRGSLLGEHISKTTLTNASTFTESGEVGVVLEIGASNSTIALVRGERVLMNRNINVSGDDFTVAIQKAFGLDFNTAEDVKLNYATATIPTEDEEDLLDFDVNRERYSPAKIFDAIRTPLLDLTTEIRRSLEFYRVQSGDINVDRMYLAGGGAKLRGLADAIGDTLGFRVELGDPWLAVTFDENAFDAAYLRSTSAELTVPLGLALRGVNGVD